MLTNNELYNYLCDYFYKAYEVLHTCEKNNDSLDYAKMQLDESKDIFKKIEQNYIKAVDKQKFLQIVKGMLHHIDIAIKFSDYDNLFSGICDIPSNLYERLKYASLIAEETILSWSIPLKIDADSYNNINIQPSSEKAVLVVG